MMNDTRQTTRRGKYAIWIDGPRNAVTLTDRFMGFVSSLIRYDGNGRIASHQTHGHKQALMREQTIIIKPIHVG